MYMDKSNNSNFDFQKAEAVEFWAGLRPSRTSVRLESEEIQIGDESIQVNLRSCYNTLQYKGFKGTHYIYKILR